MAISEPYPMASAGVATPDTERRDREREELAQFIRKIVQQEIAAVFRRNMGRDHLAVFNDLDEGKA